MRERNYRILYQNTGEPEAIEIPVTRVREYVVNDESLKEFCLARVRQLRWEISEVNRARNDGHIPTLSIHIYIRIFLTNELAQSFLFFPKNNLALP